MENNLKPAKQALIAALYGRVSTGRQENEATIESQIDEVKARIAADGNILPENNIFVDDGWTGEMLQRPALDAMRDAGLAGQFQILYVYDRGRLARKFAYQEIVIEELNDHNIQFVTLKDVNAVTPEEHVLQAMQGVFAEYERIKIAERMRRGKLYKARNGVVINGQAPFGYRYVKKTETAPTHYEVNEEEVEIVRKIFHWVGIERISLNEVLRRMYDLGIKPRRRKSDFWTKGPLLRLLKNEAYFKGVIYYNKSEAVVAKKPLKHEKYKKIKRNSRVVRPREEWIPYKVTPIITDTALFDKVQEVLAYNQRYAHSMKQQRFDYLLTGKIYCGCGARRAGDGTSKYGHFYYRCTSKTKKTDIKSNCQASGINAAVMDGLFWLKLREYLLNKDFLRQQAEQWLTTQMRHSQINSDEKEKLSDLINKTKDEQTRYSHAYGEGALDFEQFSGLMKESKKKAEGYQKRLNTITEAIDGIKIDKDQLDLLCKEAEEVVKKYEFANKKQLINDIIDQVSVSEMGLVKTRGHLPLFAQSWDSKPNVTQELEMYAASRNSRTAKRREIDAF